MSTRIDTSKSLETLATPINRVRNWFKQHQPAIEVEYVSGKECGDGKYVLKLPEAYPLSSQNDLATLLAKVQGIVERVKWIVPLDILNRVIHGGTAMIPMKLTAAIQKLGGHNTSRVISRYYEDIDGTACILLEVSALTSRATFAGDGECKNRIIRTGTEICVPEMQMYTALQISPPAAARNVTS